ncbi:MAG: DnaD domain protein [Bacillales bacterium]|jgi:DNA replication protein|nr:DnaD domain protein [Bacillales bacterium]
MDNNIISFEKALINYYRELDLSENEVVILLLINYCLESGTSYVPPSIIILKMKISMDDLQVYYVNLMNKGYVINIVDGTKKMQTSLKGIKDALTKIFLSSYKENTNEFKSIFEIVEKEFGRTFSPPEIDIIKSWIEYGFTQDLIVQALSDATSSKYKTIGNVDKILRSYRIREEIRNEGGTTISDKWDKNIEETNKITTKTWLDDDE